MSNHLGNVLAVLLDKRKGVDTDADGFIDHYKARITTAQDYFPFGMVMQGRENGSYYRYGFNGKENDNEVKGEGNQQDYGMRIYDTRSGRFLSVDPLTPEYAELTQYQFASNSPISGIDLDGGEFKYYSLQWKDNGSTRLKVGNKVTVHDQWKLNLVFKVTNAGQSSLVEIPITIYRSDFGLSGNFVNYNGKAVRVPTNFVLNDLPSQTDEVWETFESAEEIEENFIAGLYQIVDNVQNLASLKGIFIKDGGKAFFAKNGIQQKVQTLGSLRRQAVRQAWAQKKELVEKTGQGSIQWTKKELAEIRKRGKVKGYEGHHINSVSPAPGQAGDPNNIDFVKGRKGNLERHGGDFRNPTSGELVDRRKILMQRLKKK